MRFLLVFFLILAGVSAVVLILPFTSLWAKKVFLSPPSFSLKSDSGRTNILILGVPGPDHDGPNLTDTMIVASVATSSATLISVPRDIYLDSIQSKINATYETGLTRGAGLVLPKEAVSQVTGLPIHYAVVVDFSVFEKIVDLVGGVDINVPHAFDDYEYPIEGKENDLCGGDPKFACRFAHLRFDAGPQYMNGATALKFARSRQAEGDEGSDFARSRRQQLVTGAIKDKVFSNQTLLNPAKITALYYQLKTHITTDFDFSLLSQGLKLAPKFQGSTLKSVALDENLLENPPLDERGWILLPKGGNWDRVHQFISDQLSDATPPPQKQ